MLKVKHLNTYNSFHISFFQEQCENEQLKELRGKQKKVEQNFQKVKPLILFKKHKAACLKG